MRANYRTHHNNYIEFCQQYKYEPYPADEWRYCQYTQHLAWQNKKPGTVDNYVSTVRTMHKLEGLPCPEPRQIHYQKLSQGLKKSRKEPVKQAAPINQAILQAIFNQVNFTLELEAVAWVAVLVGFCLILRISNLGPAMCATFDPNKNFVRSDLQFRRSFWIMTVRWMKTIQHMNRILQAPLVPCKNKKLCPQHWVKCMVKLIPAEHDELSL